MAIVWQFVICLSWQNKVYNIWCAWYICNQFICQIIYYYVINTRKTTFMYFNLYLLNAQESRNMYFFKEWEYFHNKINFSKSSFTYYKDIVYPVCNETKLEISWLNCIFLEMAKPYDLWADTFFNKFQQQFLFHWLEIIVISHYYLSIQLSDPIKVITKCPTSNQKLVQILCLFLPTYKQMRFWKSKITLFIQKWNIVTVHRLISFVKQLENQNHASFP